MTTWDTGSIGVACLAIIDNVPAAISGTIPVFVEAAAQKIMNYNGDEVLIAGFDAKYMPAVLNYTLASLSQAMAVQGTDAATIRLGDFSIGKGKESSISAESQKYLVEGDKALDDLGRDVSCAKSFD